MPIWLGVKTIIAHRRRQRDRENRLLAIVQGFLEAAEIGRKKNNRLALLQKMIGRKLEGRRTPAKLQELVDLVMEKPLVFAGMLAKTLEVTPQAARGIVSELSIREMMRREGFGHGCG